MFLIYIVDIRTNSELGPGRFNIEQRDGSVFNIRHAFDGLPFMHRFQVNGSTQTLTYSSRMLAKSLEDSIKDKSCNGLVFFGHIPEMSFLQWLHNFYFRFYSLILSPQAAHLKSPSGQSVGVTVTPNFPLPANVEKRENEHVLVSKTDANVLQKVDPETLGN